AIVRSVSGMVRRTSKAPMSWVEGVMPLYNRKFLPALVGPPQDLVHRLTPGEFVDQLVEVADFAHQRLFDIFDPDAADHPLDQAARAVHRGSLAKKVAQICLGRDQLLELLLAVTRQPADDLVDLGLGAPLALRLGDIMRIDAREAVLIDPLAPHRRPLFSGCFRPDRERVDALSGQIAERLVHRALTRDARLPGKARPFDREAEMRFAAAVVPRMAMMLRAVVAESEGSTRKSSGKQPLHFALHWTFFAHAPMLGTKAQPDKPPPQPT